MFLERRLPFCDLVFSNKSYLFICIREKKLTHYRWIQFNLGKFNLKKLLMNTTQFRKILMNKES